MCKKYFCIQITTGNSTMKQGRENLQAFDASLPAGRKHPWHAGAMQRRGPEAGEQPPPGRSASAPRGRGQRLRRARAGGGSAAEAGKRAPGEGRPPAGTSERTLSRIIRCLPSELGFVGVMFCLFIYLSSPANLISRV